MDSESGKRIESWTIPEQHSIVGFSPDRKRVLFSTHYIFFSGLRLQGQEEPKQECKLVLHDLEKRQDVWVKSEMLTDRQWKGLDFCLFSSDDKWLVTCARYSAGHLRMWDAKAGKELWHNKEQTQFLQPIGFTEEEKTLVTRGANDNDIYLFDCASGKQIRSFRTMPSG
jgi:WD40 repeat protein